jgi:hypothetical protein
MDESEISEFHKSLLERTDSGFTLIDLDTYTDLKAIKAIRNALPIRKTNGVLTVQKLRSWRRR